jgi:hypothetical protein
MPQPTDEYAPRARYLVVRDQDEWEIKFEGEEFGPYKSQREAIAVRDRRRAEAGRAGRPYRGVGDG